MDRLTQLRNFVEQHPDDPFPRYGVAMELKNQGRLDEAEREFSDLLGRFPDYTAAYLHAGGVLAALGRKADAARVYQKGIETAGRKRDEHARSELQGALADLGGALDAGGDD